MKFTLHVAPFPDIRVRFGRGYPDITESIRSYKIPILSRKTDSEWNKELQSNLVNHRFALPEKEAQQAVRHGWDVDDSELLDAFGRSSGGVSESKEPEVEPEFDMFAPEDDDDDEYEEEEEADDTRVGGVTETAEETVNPKALIIDKFLDAGYNYESVPYGEKELREFMKTLRDKKIVTVNYVTKKSEYDNRARVFKNLGLKHPDDPTIPSIVYVKKT